MCTQAIAGSHTSVHADVSQWYKLGVAGHVPLLQACLSAGLVLWSQNVRPLYSNACRHLIALSLVPSPQVAEH